MTEINSILNTGKSMKKKALGVSLAVISLTALSGCGDSDNAASVEPPVNPAAVKAFAELLKKSDI